MTTALFARGILSIPEAACLAHCSASMLYRRARSGRLPFSVVRQPGDRFWTVDEGSLRDWITSREEDTTRSNHAL